ncbi:MAG: sodium/proline symporter PutP [Alphaproteobacteria bacterium]|nr:MAG: sodium/proline symporter PutP [Alphaproteobacteria bacterium]
MQLTITVILYFLIIFYIGYLGYKSTKSMSDYILGGRKLNSIVTALGVGASDMSGFLMLGIPGAAYAVGLQSLWIPIGLCIGAYLNWKLVAHRLHEFTIKANNALTIPTYLEARFSQNHRLLRLVTAVIILIFFTLYSSSSFVSCALLFQTSFGISYKMALFISVPVIVIYAGIGGFLAVNWVDVFQGTLMLFAMLFLPLVTLFSIGGTGSLIQQIGPGYFDIYHDVSIVSLVSSLSWGLGYFGQPHLLVRFMAAKNKTEIKKARWICMTWMILCLVGAFLVGFLGRVYFAGAPLANPEAVFMSLSKALANPWIEGVLIAAALSSVMSTVAALLILASSAFAEDIYHFTRKKEATPNELIWIGRLAVFVVSVIAVYFAWDDTKNSVLSLVGHAWAGLGSSFGPIILLSLFWKRMTARGAISGMVVGTATIFIWMWLSSIYKEYEIFQLYELLPGFIANLTAIILVSLCDRSHNYSQKFFD